MEAGAGRVGCGTDRRLAHSGPAGLSDFDVHDVPRHPGHDCQRTQSARSDSCCEPTHPCIRRTAQHARQSQELDRRSAKDKAGCQHAGDGTGGRRFARACRLSERVEMSAGSDALTGISALSPDQQARLERAWGDEPGFYGWLKSVNHKTIGRRFIVTAMCFFAAAGILAAIMRLQLARPANTVVGPDLYNQLFTVHGTTMMFLFAVPVMQAMAVYFVPIMVGTRNIAFARMNAFAYWIYLFGGLMLFGALMVNAGPDAGWFSYVPLAGPEYSA